MNNFARSLNTHHDNPALLTRAGVVTYRQLAGMAAEVAERLGETRRLVFLESANTPEVVATYLGCLIGGHPVHLFGAQDQAKVARLVDIYRPNRVFASKGGVPTLESSHDLSIDLHPALRVLLATSGSTGSPKLVKLSEQNINSNASSIAQYLDLNDTERALTSLKFNYSYGMSIVNSHIASGGALVLTEHSVVDSEFWELYHRAEATSFAGVPYTFETLKKMGEQVFRSPHLRYVTQAGGRLSPDLVRHYAAMGEASGWRFYVMYGQTEASPRISYLPPEHASRYPDCIGIAIPGGQILLLDEKGSQIESADSPGELAYVGPNVMMGYAEGVADLSTDQTPPMLKTGDVACRNSAGLFYITGRSSRFVKPFGIRVNLDDVEAQVRKWAPDAACAGTDEKIIVALVEPEQPMDAESRIATLSALYGLPAFVFQILALEQIPRLPSGKPDYRTIVAQSGVREAGAPGATKGRRGKLRNTLSIVFSTDFVRQMNTECQRLLGVGSHTWHSVADIFTTVIADRSVSSEDTFTELAGDSLSYVQASLALEEYLGNLPVHWERMTVFELEQLRSATSI
jgi:acyl-CoA synthetase (AMP-forming)/AMP-acid ligase II